MKVEGKAALAHRVVAYAIGIVVSPFYQKGGQVVMHSCDNPACCNPRHLSVGSQSENMQDCSYKGRMGRPT